MEFVLVKSEGLLRYYKRNVSMLSGFSSRVLLKVYKGHLRKSNSMNDYLNGIYEALKKADVELCKLHAAHDYDRNRLLYLLNTQMRPEKKSLASIVEKARIPSFFKRTPTVHLINTSECVANVEPCFSTGYPSIKYLHRESRIIERGVGCMTEVMQTVSEITKREKKRGSQRSKEDCAISSLGVVIKRFRETTGAKRPLLAKSVGISENHLREIEAGRREPSSDILKKIAGYFRVSPHVLVFFSDNPNLIGEYNPSQKVSPATVRIAMSTLLSWIVRICGVSIDDDDEEGDEINKIE